MHSNALRGGANTSYGHQGLKEKEAASRIQEVSSLKQDKFKVTVSLDKERPMSTSPLYNKYNIQRFDLHPNFSFAHLDNMIPKGTPEYLDHGLKLRRTHSTRTLLFQAMQLDWSFRNRQNPHRLPCSGTDRFADLGSQLRIIHFSHFDLIGRFIGLGKENWVDGLLTQWLRKGGIMYLDEANMMKQDVATRLNPVLDTRGHLVLNEKDSEVIERHKYGYMIISMNPATAEFSGTKPLNAAMRRRMAVWINFDFLSVGEKISPMKLKCYEKEQKSTKTPLTKLSRQVQNCEDNTKPATCHMVHL